MEECPSLDPLGCVWPPHTRLSTEDFWDRPGPSVPSSGVLVCSIRADGEQPDNNYRTRSLRLSISWGLNQWCPWNPSRTSQPYCTEGLKRISSIGPASWYGSNKFQSGHKHVQMSPWYIFLASFENISAKVKKSRNSATETFRNPSNITPVLFQGIYGRSSQQYYTEGFK